MIIIIDYYQDYLNDMKPKTIGTRAGVITVLKIPNNNISQDHIKKQYIILGTITKEGQFSFDPINYIDFFQVTRLMIFGYKDYMKSIPTHTDYTCKTKEDSFMTLLNSNDLFLNNSIDNMDSTTLEENEIFLILKNKRKIIK